jgi:hypothetical protein
LRKRERTSNLIFQWFGFRGGWRLGSGYDSAALYGKVAKIETEKLLLCLILVFQLHLFVTTLERVLPNQWSPMNNHIKSVCPVALC